MAQRVDLQAAAPEPRVARLHFPYIYIYIYIYIHIICVYIYNMYIYYIYIYIYIRIFIYIYIYSNFQSASDWEPGKPKDAVQRSKCGGGRSA